MIGWSSSLILVELADMMRFVFVLLGCLVSGPAFSWNLFGPKSLEECILLNMKGVTSDQAAAIIYATCQKKFPSKNVESPPLVRAGTPRVDRWDNLAASKAVQNLVPEKWMDNNHIQLTNKNRYPVAGIYVSHSKDVSCPNSREAYQQIYSCSAVNNFVEGNLTGNFYCADAAVIRRKYTCVVGFYGVYQDDVDAFFRRLAAGN